MSCPLGRFTGMGSRVHTDWEGMIAEHDPVVVLALLSKGLRIHEAKEIAHDTWARLFEQHRAGKLPRLELPGLAIRQALFLASDFRRQRDRHSVQIETQRLVDPHASVEARLETRQQLLRTEAAAAQLSPRAQTVFATVMTHPETPHAELAQRLGLSIQRLRQSLCEVRGRLKAALEESR
jgi:RNA polymerase sigma factor (sigma-70 family)